MEVRPGYKQSEVGVVPEDWDIKPLLNFADVKTGPFGSALHERDYVSDGTPIITVEHLGDQGVVHENLPLVSDQDRNRLSSYSLRSGDIVFSRVGSVDRNALIRDSEDGWLFSGRLLRVRVLRNDVYPPYLSYHFHSEPFKKRVRNVAVGQTMASLNTQILKGVCAVLPPEPEQRAIATALSDVDALLGGLQRLIAKKRDIKQAVMQQLLTGQTRLPGFSGEWEVKRMGDVADVLKGSGLSKSLISASGAHSCILYGELFTTYGRVISNVVSRTNANEGCRSMAGDVLLPGSTTTTGADLATASALLVEGIALGGDIIIVRRKGRCYDPVFLASYLTHTAKREIAELTQGITIHHLYGKDVKTLSLRLPSLPEQTAIAAVLSDMDAELAALEARREKTLALKQAMMQELLTGRTRLI